MSGRGMILEIIKMIDQEIEHYVKRGLEVISRIAEITPLVPDFLLL